MLLIIHPITTDIERDFSKMNLIHSKKNKYLGVEVQERYLLYKDYNEPLEQKDYIRCLYEYQKKFGKLPFKKINIV